MSNEKAHMEFVIFVSNVGVRRCFFGHACICLFIWLLVCLLWVFFFFFFFFFFLRFCFRDELFIDMSVESQELHFLLCLCLCLLLVNLLACLQICFIVLCCRWHSFMIGSCGHFCLHSLNNSQLLLCFFPVFRTFFCSLSLLFVV